VFSHDHRRLAWHYLGHLDPERVMLANSMIGMTGSPFWGVFGDPTIVLRYACFYTVRIIRVSGAPQRDRQAESRDRGTAANVSVRAEAV
jgi:hypothetical protein